jgi:hypothetical protein
MIVNSRTYLLRRYNLYILKCMAIRKNYYVSNNELTSRQKRELTKAVKKTVKQYHTTLKLLAKT